MTLCRIYCLCHRVCSDEVWHTKKEVSVKTVSQDINPDNKGEVWDGQEKHFVLDIWQLISNSLLVFDTTV